MGWKVSYFGKAGNADCLRLLDVKDCSFQSPEDLQICRWDKRNVAIAIGRKDRRLKHELLETHEAISQSPLKNFLSLLGIW
jgi:hypothetical protein